MGRVHFHTARVLSVLILLLGVAMIVTTIGRGGGPLSLGVVLGVAFAALGAARLYLGRMLREPR